jgi:TonB family protein
VTAKGAFDKKDYAAASRGFSQVLAGLNDPDIESTASQPPLSDLKMLASGFNDLAAKAVTPATPVAPATPVVEPMVERVARVYSPSDTNVVPPITVRQAVPPYPGRVLLGGSVVMDVIIDATGAVESATMSSPPNPAYDRLALGATKTWQYQPALLDGKPVKYRKRIQITLVPSSTAPR